MKELEALGVLMVTELPTVNVPLVVGVVALGILSSVTDAEQEVLLNVVLAMPPVAEIVMPLVPSALWAMVASKEPMVTHVSLAFRVMVLLKAFEKLPMFNLPE